MVPLRSEEIYDALLDDEQLEALPARMVEAYGGRSCVLHWRYEGGGADVFSHSRYYTDEQLLEYVENYAGTDLWALRACERENVNRAWNCDLLVPEDEYSKSEFYNGWIRGMGDDTYHCVGIAIRTEYGNGIIGIHRGRTQGSFSEATVQELELNAAHLRRMLAIRGKLAVAAKTTDHLIAVTDTLGQPVITVTSAGRVVHLNQAAEAILRRGDGLAVRNGVFTACSASCQRKLADAISRASRALDPEASAVRVRRSGGGEYILSIVSLPTRGGGREVMIAVTDPAAGDRTLHRRLQSAFHLSSSEACVAVRLSEGATAAEIADERGVALGTVRTQVKVVATKLGCHRQTDIVRIVKSLPRFAGPSR